MPRHDFSRKVDYSARQMFDLVADVANYNEFLPLCEKSDVSDLQIDKDGVRRFRAALLIEHKRLKVSENFISDVIADPNRLTVIARSKGGPIKQLENTWRFVDLGRGGSQARMVLDFEMSSLPLRLLMKASFDLVMAKMTSSFEQRAAMLYGG